MSRSTNGLASGRCSSCCPGKDYLHLPPPPGHLSDRIPVIPLGACGQKLPLPAGKSAGQNHRCREPRSPFPGGWDQADGWLVSISTMPLRRRLPLYPSSQSVRCSATISSSVRSRDNLAAPVRSLPTALERVSFLRIQAPDARSNPVRGGFDGSRNTATKVVVSIKDRPVASVNCPPVP